MGRWVGIGRDKVYIIFEADVFLREYTSRGRDIRGTVLALIKNAVETMKPIKLYTRDDLIRIVPELQGKLPTEGYEVFETESYI